MKQFFDYIGFHKKALILFATCTIIFCLVFFLSNIPLEAVLYAALLSFIAGVVVVCYDFYHFRRHHKALEKLVESIDAQIDHLPEPRNLIDADYTEIIRELHRQKRQSESRAYVEQKELADYFTLWAHQIKTPIAAMGLLIQSRGEHTDWDREFAMELFDVEEYVNTAMSYIRLKDISSDLAFDKIPLDDVIRRVLKKYARLFIGRRISMDFKETDYVTVTDEKWLTIVLGQILTNSLKYTPEGGKISIELEGDQLFIRDNGIGVRAEDLPRLFEKGFTGENGRQYNKSTGQGLYLCKTIMDKLSHGISITSKEGEGTTVILDFDRPDITKM